MLSSQNQKFVIRFFDFMNLKSSKLIFIKIVQRGNRFKRNKKVHFEFLKFINIKINIRIYTKNNKENDLSFERTNFEKDSQLNK